MQTGPPIRYREAINAIGTPRAERARPEAGAQMGVLGKRVPRRRDLRTAKAELRRPLLAESFV